MPSDMEFAWLSSSHLLISYANRGTDDVKCKGPYVLLGLAFVIIIKYAAQGNIGFVDSEVGVYACESAGSISTTSLCYVGTGMSSTDRQFIYTRLSYD